MNREVCEHNKEIGKYCHECYTDDGSNSALIGLLEAPVEIDAREVAKGKLILQCARILHSELSPYAEDWPKTTPKSVLHAIDDQTERLRSIVANIRQIIHSI